VSRPGIRPAAVTAAFGAALALACAAVPEAVLAAAAAPAKPVLERSVLKNGLTSYRLERAGLPLVQMQLLIPAGGTADPAGKEGLAALTARLLSRGSAGRTAAAFAEEVEFLGGSLQADAGLDRTLIAGEFAARDFEAGLALLAGMVRKPAFDAAEFARERDLLAASRDAELDDTGGLASEALARALFAGHPYARPVDGFRPSLRRLTREDVVAWHARRFQPGEASLALVGPIDGARARRAIERAFGDWKRGAPADQRPPEIPVVRGRAVLLVDKPEATQSQIRIGQKTVPRTDPAWPALSAANAVLGSGFSSWLNDEIRVKRGLAYGIASRLVSRRVGAAFEVITATRNDKAEETVGLALDLVGRMHRADLAEADLDRARNYLSGLFPLRIESPDALATTILERPLLGLDPKGYAAFPEELRAVRLEAAKEAARRGIPGDSAAIVVVGPASVLKEPLAKFGPVTVRPAAWVVDGD